MFLNRRNGPTPRAALLAFAVATFVGSSTVRADFTTSINTNANSLANAALGGGGITINSATLNGHSSSSGLYTIGGGPATYGLTRSGIVLSTGNVLDYSTGPNTSGSNGTSFGVAATAAQQALLVPIAGNASYFDVTELTINFTLGANQDRIFFDVVFGSEEFPEFVGTNFIDGFGLYVNSTNIAYANGSPININHPDFANISGTQLDGVVAPGGNPIMTFSSILGFGASGSLTFIIADRGDSIYDSTAFISSLTGGDVTGPQAGEVPAPGGLILALTGSTGFFGLRLAKRRREV